MPRPATGRIANEASYLPLIFLIACKTPGFIRAEVGYEEFFAMEVNMVRVGCLLTRFVLPCTLKPDYSWSVLHKWRGIGKLKRSNRPGRVLSGRPGE
jgi:hypothetical protein